MLNKFNIVANPSSPKQGPKFEDPRQRGGLWRNGFVSGMGMELRLSREVDRICTSAGLAHSMIDRASKVFSLKKGAEDIEILMTAIAGNCQDLGVEKW